VEWLTEVVKSSASSPAVFPAVFFLGLVGSVTSCCNLPIIGAIAGYSGTFGDDGNRRSLLLGALFFMLGTTSAFAALGAVSGFIGQVAADYLGFYWKLFAGFIMVLFGLATLNLLPFDLAKRGFAANTWKLRSSGATIYGFALGGGAATCSMCCSPVLPIALVLATLKGHTIWGAGILAMFSIGYSLPMVVGLVSLGLGFGKLTSLFRNTVAMLKPIAGCLLIAAGFYMLSTA